MKYGEVIFSRGERRCRRRLGLPALDKEDVQYLRFFSLGGSVRSREKRMKKKKKKKKKRKKKKKETHRRLAMIGNFLVL